MSSRYIRRDGSRAIYEVSWEDLDGRVIWSRQYRKSFNAKARALHLKRKGALVYVHECTQYRVEPTWQLIRWAKENGINLRGAQ
jgi:hypothetical protein